jgi:hypothetical protein
MKTVTDAPDDARLICSRKLEQVAKELGSDATAVYHIKDTKQVEQEWFELEGQFLEANLRKELPDTMKLGLFNTEIETKHS